MLLLDLAMSIRTSNGMYAINDVIRSLTFTCWLLLLFICSRNVETIQIQNWLTMKFYLLVVKWENSDTMHDRSMLFSVFLFQFRYKWYHFLFGSFITFWLKCLLYIYLTSCIVLSGFFDDIFKNRSWAWQNLPVFLSNFFLCSFTPPIRSFRKFSNGTTIWLWAWAICKSIN